MVLYELLTLQMPYEGYDAERLLTVVQKGRRPDLPALLVSASRSSAGVGSAVGAGSGGKAAQAAGSSGGADASAHLERIVELYKRCTNTRPVDRPSAADLVKELSAIAGNV
jgi:hypothetical protein